MESAAKHLAWAGSLVACVYLATSNNWQPIALHIVANAPNTAVAALPPAGAASANPASLTPYLATARNLDGQAAPAPAPAPAAAQQTSNLAYATIEDAKVAKQVTDTLAKLAAVVDVPAGTPEGQVATIFFDPRCPYCHAAFTAMHGRIAARWVPVVVLGDAENGNRQAAAILAGSDRVGALKTAFETKGGKPGEITPEIAAQLAENRDAFASIFAAAPQLRPGVPTMFVPRPDGRLAIMVGYEPGDDAKLRTVLSGS
jgi:hypothetical protein